MPTKGNPTGGTSHLHFEHATDLPPPPPSPPKKYQQGNL